MGENTAIERRLVQAEVALICAEAVARLAETLVVAVAVGKTLARNA